MVSRINVVVFLIFLFFGSNCIQSIQIDFSIIDAEQLRRSVLAGASCVDIIDQFLHRIEKYEKGPTQLNAVVTINPHAREEAADLDKHFHRTGSIVGTLHCIPVMVGDNIDVAQMPTTVGVRALSGSIAPRDADVVQLLKNQGAVVVGKGNISPFTWEHRYVESETAGLAKNAYCPGCTTYGASGGAAQATAAVYALIGLGTDSGGSIALPASAASCLGLRPSWNLVSTRGIVQVHEFMDVVGPFARYASDMALVMDILDPSKRGRGFYGRVVQEAENGLSGVRIGVIADLVYDKVVWPMASGHGSALVTVSLTSEIRSLTIKAIDDMKSLGAEFSNLTLQVHRIAPHLTAFGEFDVTSCTAEWLDSYMNRLTPPAPYNSLSQLLRSRTLPDAFQRFFDSAQRKSVLHQCDTVSGTFHRARSGLRDQIMEPLFSGNKDVLLFPMLADFPTKIHDRRDQPLIGVQLSSLAGYPSLTLPVGFSGPSADAPRGLPTSVLLVAKPGRMDALLKVAAAYQHRFGKIILPELVSSSGRSSTNILEAVFSSVILLWWLGGRW